MWKIRRECAVNFQDFFLRKKLEFWLTLDFINQLCSQSTKENVNFQAHRGKGKMRIKKINQLSRKEGKRKIIQKQAWKIKNIKWIQLQQIQ